MTQNSPAAADQFTSSTTVKLMSRIAATLTPRISMAVDF